VVDVVGVPVWIASAVCVRNSRRRKGPEPGFRDL